MQKCSILTVIALAGTGIVTVACSEGSAPGGWNTGMRGLWFPARAAKMSKEDQEELAALPYLRGKSSGGERGVTSHSPDDAQAGLNVVVSGHAAEASLVEMGGRVLHTWALELEDVWPDGPGFEFDAARGTCWRRAHMLADGSLLAIFDRIGMVKIDKNSKLVWAWPGRCHDDLAVGADGRIHTLAPAAAVAVAGAAYADDIVTLSPTGAEVGRLAVSECVGASGDGARVLGGLALVGGQGDLLVWEGGTVLRIDRVQKKATPVGKAALSGVRDVAVASDGRMVVFDTDTEGRSAVLTLERSGAQVSQFPAVRSRAFACGFLGACQLLANGNMLVTESDKGRAFEVTPAGAIAWEYINPERANDGALIAALCGVERVEAKPLGEVFPAVAEALQAAARQIDTGALETMLENGKKNGK